MASTRRQVNTILANLPDNISGDITPENVRDSFISAIPEFIQFHATPGSLPHPIVIPAASGWIDISIAGLATITDNWTPAAPPPGSEYTGPIDVGIFGMLAISFQSANNRELYEFRLLKNGIQDDGSVVQIPTAHANALSAGHGVIPVSTSIVPGDVVKTQVRQLTGQDDISITAYSGWWISRAV